MLYQEDLREAQVVAVWVGDIETEGDLAEYLGTPFESDFGFLLDLDDLPEFSRSFDEPRFHAHHNRPFLKTDVSELIEAFSWPTDLKDQTARACREKGFDRVKTVVVFPHLRYREELCRNLHGQLHFIANLPWSEGEELWATLQSKRIIAPPFPKLIRHEFGDEGSNLWYWKTHIQLEAWKGFAAYSELSSMGWSPTKGCLPDGDFSLTVDPVSRTASHQPTAEQARAFELLTQNHSQLYASVLAAIFKAYPGWRENHFGGQWSDDGGKTYKSGWELPEMLPPDEMPEVKSVSEMTRLVRPDSFGILAASNDGIAQIRIGFSCKWDEEHGFAVLIRGGKDIEVGDSDLGI
ncbi:MAG TPA: hypothetical protein VFZ59_19440 [Verrucomicrobiae bacterium]|nr:hypothetical protein [Verrucomicrobiae bacterium]